MSQSAPMSLAKLHSTLRGTFTPTSSMVNSFPFNDPGSKKVPEAISLKPTKISENIPELMINSHIFPVCFRNIAMVSKSVIIFVAIAFLSIVSAKDFMLGDDKGWAIKFDYQAWTQEKEFYVGDSLVFRYPVGAHNVLKVTGTAFQNCIKPPLSEGLITGNDTIVLATPGQKWYICGVGQHCAARGQKLLIVVNPVAISPSVAPSQRFGAPTALPAGSANGIVLAWFQSIMAVSLAIFFVIAV